MRLPLLLAAAGLAFAAIMAGPAAAITVTPGNWANADATIGEDVQDANDVVVKPCDCEPVADPGMFRVYRQNRSLVRIHYEDVEGTTIATTDGTMVGTVVSVQNISGTGPIVLVVAVEGGVLGSVSRINVRRNAFYWTGSAAVINTTIDDLRSSIRALGIGV
jgi:hypothetical protein